LSNFEAFYEKDDPNVDVRTTKEYQIFISDILGKISLKRFSKGHFICHHGEIGEEMYVVHKGRPGLTEAGWAYSSSSSGNRSTPTTSA
jgi:hypothetical protein